jgi:hypothetical protein
MKDILLKYYIYKEPPPIIATMAVDMEGEVKPKPIIATMVVDMEGEVKPKPIIATMEVDMNGKMDPKPNIATMAVDMNGKVEPEKPPPNIATMDVAMNGKVEPEKPKPIIATMAVDMEGKVKTKKTTPTPIIATMAVDMEGKVEPEQPKPIIATMAVDMEGKVEPEQPKPIIATMAVNMKGKVEPNPPTPTTPIIATMEVNMQGKIEPSGVGDTFIITDKTENKSWSTSPQMIFDTITFKVIKRETVVASKPSTNSTLYLISGTTSDLDETTGKQKTHYFIVNKNELSNKIDIYYTLYQKDISPNVFDFINNEEKAITTFETICGVSQKNNGNFDEYIYSDSNTKDISLLDIRTFFEFYEEKYNEYKKDQIKLDEFFEKLQNEYPQINPIKNLSTANEDDITLIENTTKNIKLLIDNIEEIIKIQLTSEQPKPQ